MKAQSMPEVAPEAASPTRKLSGDRIPVLDGLRGIAILLVMYRHFGSVETAGAGGEFLARTTEIGWVGVDLFFVLSGFLITGILLDTRTSENYFRSFYARRVLRIFPLYYFFLCVTLFVFAPLTGASELTDRQLPLWTYLTNLDIVRYGWFSGDASVANHLWSLAVEEQFYFLWPLLVYFVDRKWLGWLAVAGMLISPLGRIWIDATGHGPFMAYVATPTRLDSLSMGALIAILSRSVPGSAALKRYAPAALFVSAVAIVALYMNVAHYRFSNWTVLHWGLPAHSIGFGALLVIATNGAPSGWLPRLLSSESLRFFGRYSYGMYVWHPSVSRLLGDVGVTQQRLARVLPSGAATTLGSIVIRLLATTVVSLLSWYLLESWFLRLKDRVRALPSRGVDRVRSQAA